MGGWFAAAPAAYAIYVEGRGHSMICTVLIQGIYVCEVKILDFRREGQYITASVPELVNLILITFDVLVSLKSRILMVFCYAWISQKVNSTFKME